MGPPGLPGKRGQRVGHCVFGLGVLAVLCSCERDPALRCTVVLARDYVSSSGSSPLGEVLACSCLQEVGGWRQAG